MVEITGMKSVEMMCRINVGGCEARKKAAEITHKGSEERE